MTISRLLKEYSIALPKRPKARGTGLPSPSYVSVELAQVRLAVEAIDAGDLPADALTTIDVRQMLDHGGKGTNLRARFGALSRFFDWCQDGGHIPSNPCGQITRARRPKGAAAAFTLSDTGRTRETLGGLRKPPRAGLARSRPAS